MTTAKATPGNKSTASTSASPNGAAAVPDASEMAVTGAAGAHSESGKTLNVKTLPVREGEEPWTKEELAEIRSALEEDIVRFESQIEISTAELVGLLRDGSEGAGRDPADVGSANFERDAEMSLANNAREMLDQSKLALRHIELGIFGNCDNCGQPIGKGRLQAFPRATLCVTCKQREERR
jgi:DnaK suppressor protein